MESYWVKTTTRPSFPCLQENIDCDICIIGAGITGIMTAYMLKESKLKICIIDKGEVCSGVTENTTAKITSEHGLIYKYLEDNFGLEFAKKYLKSNEEAINTIEEIINKEQIECDFARTSNYIYTCKEEYIQRIKDEVETVNKLGLNAKFIEKTTLPFNIKAGIEFTNQAKFHPLKYLYGIIEKLKDNDVQIFTNSRVQDIERNENSYSVKTDKNRIQAKYVVMATHYPIKNFPGMYFLKMYQDRSYAITIEPHEKFDEGMYLSAESPVASFRPIDNDLLIILGVANEYQDIYKATRLRPIKNYKEMGNMLRQSFYSLGINKLKRPKYKFEDLENDAGGVVEYKGKKLGVYKDKNGKIFVVKPYCKHLGCELSWNNLEKTWDCPCHGSRYDYTGKLINEPSTKDLDVEFRDSP